VLRIFIALKNPSPWPGFEPATFGSSGQHTKHYTTTKATNVEISKDNKLNSDTIQNVFCIKHTAHCLYIIF
jgi:hypothetical protein